MRFSPAVAPQHWRIFHAAATLTWVALLLPSMTVWAHSLPYLVLISVWANIASHWSCYQAATAEQRVRDHGKL